MAIVVGKHALRADNGVTELAKVLNLLVQMLEAVHLSRLLAGHLRSLRPSQAIVSQIHSRLASSVRSCKIGWIRLHLLLGSWISSEPGDYLHHLDVSGQCHVSDLVIYSAAKRALADLRTSQV